jgi:hypothetical protein
LSEDSQRTSDSPRAQSASDVAERLRRLCVLEELTATEEARIVALVKKAAYLHPVARDRLSHQRRDKRRCVRCCVIEIRTLRPGDDRTAFRSGDPDLDRFFHQF